jgi:hypothetical protein
MQLKKNTLIAMAAFLVSMACDSKPQGCVDERYAQDHARDVYDDFRFDPDKLPVKGKTKLEELRVLDERGPSARLTFLTPFQKDLGGRKFSVDSIWTYSYRKRITYNAPGVSGYDLVEVLYVTIFLYEGTVQDYFVTHKHRIQGSETGEMRSGKYHSGPVKDHEYYPDSIKDGHLYWDQRNKYDNCKAAQNDANKDGK